MFISCASGTKTDTPAVKVRIMVNHFTAEGVSKSTVRKIEKNITRFVADQRGHGCDCIYYRGDKNFSKSTNRQMVGRVSRLVPGKEDVFLSIRIIEGEKGKILFSRSFMAKNTSDLTGKIKKCAGEISENEEVWGK